MEEKRTHQFFVWNEKKKHQPPQTTTSRKFGIMTMYACGCILCWALCVHGHKCLSMFCFTFYNMLLLDFIHVVAGGIRCCRQNVKNGISKALKISLQAPASAHLSGDCRTTTHTAARTKWFHMGQTKQWHSHRLHCQMAYTHTHTCILYSYL